MAVVVVAVEVIVVVVAAAVVVIAVVVVVFVLTEVAKGCNLLAMQHMHFLPSQPSSSTRPDPHNFLFFLKQKPPLNLHLGLLLHLGLSVNDTFSIEGVLIYSAKSFYYPKVYSSGLQFSYHI